MIDVGDLKSERRGPAHNCVCPAASSGSAGAFGLQGNCPTSTRHASRQLTLLRYAILLEKNIGDFHTVSLAELKNVEPYA